jgi:hypothetical protein
MPNMICKEPPRSSEPAADEENEERLAAYPPGAVVGPRWYPADPRLLSPTEL